MRYYLAATAGVYSELPYLPQATEEDHGAHPFKGTGGIAVLSPWGFIPVKMIVAVASLVAELDKWNFAENSLTGIN
jgi:hypothetical protein